MCGYCATETPQTTIEHSRMLFRIPFWKQFRSPSHTTRRCQAAEKPEATMDLAIFPTCSLLTRAPVSLQCPVQMLTTEPNCPWRAAGTSAIFSSHLFKGAALSTCLLSVCGQHFLQEGGVGAATFSPGRHSTSFPGQPVTAAEHEGV